MKPHLCHVFPAFAHGGPEVRTALLLDATADQFRHTVVSLGGDLQGRDRVRPDAGVRFTPGPQRGGVRYLFRLGRLLKSVCPDLLLTYGWGGTDALLAARLAGLRRVIHTEDGFLPDEAAGQKWKRVLARRVLLRLAGRVVCPSRTLERIATGLWRLPPRSVTYLPNGIDTERFSPPTPDAAQRVRRSLGLDPGELVVGSVGHLRAEKNHARLLRAFAGLARRRSARLLLLGDGPLRAALAAQARELGVEDRVRFAGVVLDPADHYRAMDLFALSSDTEQMPLALLEAMSTGLAAVSTDVGDVAEMAGAENRPYVVAPADEGAYAAALAALAEDTAARRAVGEANRRRCLERFDLAAMTRAYLSLYRGDLEPPRSRRAPGPAATRQPGLEASRPGN